MTTKNDWLAFKIFIIIWIVVIICLIGIIIQNNIQNNRYQQKLTNSKFIIEINDKKYDNCSYKDGMYYTESGGEIYFGKEAHVILTK